MSFIAAAIVGTAVVGAGASIYASKKAGDAQIEAAQTGSDTQLKMYYQGREDQAPWMAAGESALNKLTGTGGGGLLEGPDEAFKETEAYQFVKSEGLDAMANAMSARGGVDSGGAARASGRYVTGLASQEYGNFWNRYQDKLRGYQSMAGVGQSTANVSAANAMATGQNVAGLQAAGISGQGNALAAGAMGVGSAVNQGVNNYMAYKMS